ncbi:MAG: hypothetical protein JWP87_5462 [Labilithrix sp.]|nr:hypothetical protein [Labilithrix sp.]
MQSLRQVCNDEVMYRENVAPPPPVPQDAARQAVKSCAQMQIGVAVLHVISLVLLVARFGFYKPPSGLNVSTDLITEWRMTALVAGIAYVVVFAAWAAVNAWGLGKRSKAARWSSIGFAAATMATCCAWPFGGFLLYMLLRRDVKGYFE